MTPDIGKLVYVCMLQGSPDFQTAAQGSKNNCEEFVFQSGGGKDVLHFWYIFEVSLVIATTQILYIPERYLECMFMRSARRVRRGIKEWRQCGRGL